MDTSSPTAQEHPTSSAARMVIAAALVFWVNAAAHAQEYHGSIAFAATPAGGYAGGMAWNYQSHAKARESALHECRWAGGGDACREVGWFQNACGAIAIGDGNGYGTGWGDTNAAAERAALTECRKANQSCRIEISRCTDLATTATVELDRAARRSIQAALAAQGFDPGPADGMFGRRTQAALQAWQAAKGYTATGHLTTAQARVLLATRQITPQETPTETPSIDQSGNLWGSIAFSQNPKKGHAWAISWNAGGAAQAKKMALDECRRQGGQNCQEIAWFRDACGALAIGDGNGFGSGWGTTTAIAERYALAKCRSLNQSCRIEISRCSDKPTETSGVVSDAEGNYLMLFVDNVAGRRVWTEVWASDALAAWDARQQACRQAGGVHCVRAGEATKMDAETCQVLALPFKYSHPRVSSFGHARASIYRSLEEATSTALEQCDDAIWEGLINEAYQKAGESGESPSADIEALEPRIRRLEEPGSSECEVVFSHCGPRM